MNPILITFLVVLGAGAGVIIGYAISYRYLNKPGLSDYEKMCLELSSGEESQQSYMAGVRERNHQNIMAMC